MAMAFAIKDGVPSLRFETRSTASMLFRHVDLDRNSRKFEPHVDHRITGCTVWEQRHIHAANTYARADEGAFR
jgi:hypothetical protein